MIELIQSYIRADSAVKLSAQLEELVRSGQLPPHALLPPVRDLARAVGVSPNTAAAAYRALRQQGVVSTDGRRGTRVLPQPSQRETVEPLAPAGTLDLRVAQPDLALLPDLRPILARIDARSGDYSAADLDPGLGSLLREALEDEGVPAAHLLVTSGAIPALYRALAAWGGPGDKVGVEDPGFNEHHASVAALGREAVPVEVDAEGVVPASLRAALRAGVTALLLTPRAQSPAGGALGPARAAELRKLLAGFPDVGLALDDYASELCEGPFPALLPRGHRRFLVARSFNKALGPDLRVAVAAADGATAAHIERGRWLSDGRVSGYAQRVAAAALADKAVRAQLARARRVYTERRDALLRALEARGLQASGASGLHVWLPVDDEAVAVAGALAAGFCVRSGTRYRLRSPPAVRITTSRLAPAVAGRLAQALSAVLLPAARQLGSARAP